MQQSMPEHLRKYTEGNSYVPKHAEKAISQHMVETAPPEFKKYANAYVQQKVMSQHTAIASSTPHLSTHDQFQPLQPLSVPGQMVSPTAPSEPPSAQNQSPGSPVAPLYPSSPAAAPESQPDAYGFITNPEQPVKQGGIKLPGGNSLAMRGLFISGGLFVLLIAFIVIKGLISGGGNLPLFVSAAQDQQELIHLATNATQQQGLTTNDQNFAATAQLSLTSAQAAIIKYLAANGTKVDLKLLSNKVSASTDAQLTTAAAATTYDQTFQEIVQAKLTTYISDLQQAYQQTTGKNGRAVLSNNYTQAQLLLTQINTTAPSQ
jgi:hypothetical protein